METIATPLGDARVDVRFAEGEPRLTLVLGHGASGGIEAPDLVALAQALPSRGISVLRVEQPWRVAGRKVASPPPTLDRAWLAVLEHLALTGSVVVGGRSAGARVACRTAVHIGAVGVLALAFPLHPPGRPDKSRLDELLNSGVPTLVVQGDRDPFGRPAAFLATNPDAGIGVVAARDVATPSHSIDEKDAQTFPRERPPYVMHPVPGADHSFRVPKGSDRRAALADITATVADWLLATNY